MLIRSQDKYSLLNINTIGFIFIQEKQCGFVLCSHHSGSTYSYMGSYSTSNRAIEVLDEICKAYEYSCVVEAHILGETPYMMINNTVFQMPAE